MRCNTFDALLDLIANGGRKSANADHDFCRRWNDIAGRTTMECGNRHNRRVERWHVTGLDGLQGHHNRSARGYGISSFFRFRAVTAVAVHPDKCFIDRRHDRPIAEGKLAEGDAGIVVKGKNSITRKAVEQSFVYHDLGTAEILFRRLEN